VELTALLTRFFTVKVLDLAVKFKRSRQWVGQRLALVESLTPKVQEYIATRVATPRHARELVRLEPHLQEKAAEKVVEEHLSSRGTKILVDALKEKPEEADTIPIPLPPPS